MVPQMKMLVAPQDDFQNLAKNCTGREHEPDCKPEERASQWYNHYEGSEVVLCSLDLRRAFP
eukprot:6473361-Amphidinium_carterae.1